MGKGKTHRDRQSHNTSSEMFRLVGKKVNLDPANKYSSLYCNFKSKYEFA